MTDDMLMIVHNLFLVKPKRNIKRNNLILKISLL